MRNPVQKMFKAASQMKNNPPLAQQQANSPNRINALAAQIVMPEQQAMQKSKPIPYPVGSVLMQRLEQAKQAAAANRYVDPREGGIAQIAAKSGGRLSFAEGGKPPKQVRPENTDFAKKARAIMAKNQQVKAERGELRRAEEQKGARYRASQERQKLREIERKLISTREGYEAEQEAKRVQRARAEGAEDFKKATAPKPPSAFNPEDYMEGTPEERSYARRVGQVRAREEAPKLAEEASYAKRQRELTTRARGEGARAASPEGQRTAKATSVYNKAKAQIAGNKADETARVYSEAKSGIARNKEIEAETQTRGARREGAAEALKTKEGKPVSPYKNKSKNVPPPDVAKRILKGREDVARGKTLEGRRDIAEELEAAKRERVGKSSVIGERGRVVPKEPATPEQKKRRSEKSKLMGVSEKTVPGKGLSKEAQQYLEGQNEPKAPETAETLASKKPDVSMEEANQRLEAASKQGKKAKASSPATLTRDIHNAANTTIAGDPAMMEEVTRLSSEANAINPDMSANERGQYIVDNASPETRSKFLSKMGPMLEKYGIAKGARGIVKGAGLLGAYESGANIANVMADPTKSKKDVASAVGHEAVETAPIAAGAGVGAGLGAFGGPLAPLTVPLGGIVGGAAGAYYGEPGVRKLKEYLGMDQEGPQATAKHTVPTTGDLLDKAAGYMSGDSFNKSPEQRFKEEVAAMPEDEETLRLERMGRGEVPISDLVKGRAAAPSAAPVTEPKVPSAAGPGGPLPARTVSADQGGIAAAPQGQTTAAPAAAPTGQGQQRDMYAGDTSEGTPEGAIRKLQELQGPGYQYSQRVMDELESGKREQQAATVLDMMAKFGAGISNRDRYQGIHDAALLSSQAFTSGRERENQARQQFLEGIIHNEQVPFAERKSAYDMYTKMQLAAAQNEALRERSMIGAMSRMYGYDQGLIGKMLGGQGGGLETERKSLDNQLDALVSLKKSAEAMGGDTSAYDIKINSILKQLGAMSGVSGGQGLGEEPKTVRPWPTA